jgi:hypothetical protein
VFVALREDRPDVASAGAILDVRVFGWRAFSDKKCANSTIVIYPIVMRPRFQGSVRDVIIAGNMGEKAMGTLEN